MRSGDPGRPELFPPRTGCSNFSRARRGYEAYLGLPIVGSEGKVLGHLAFFDRAPRGDEMLVDSVYRIFLARAASELERMQLPRRSALPHDARTQVAK